MVISMVDSDGANRVGVVTGGRGKADNVSLGLPAVGVGRGDTGRMVVTPAVTLVVQHVDVGGGGGGDSGP